MTDILEPNVVGVLAANAGVQGVVGDKVYAQIIPQHDFSYASRIPCLVVTKVGATRQARLCDSDDPLVAATYQVDCYALEYETAVRGAQAAMQALRPFAGPAGAVRIQKVQIQTEGDIGPDPDPGLYRRTLQFAIWYYE
jgi:hypothetical protein